VKKKKYKKKKSEEVPSNTPTSLPPFTKQFSSYSKSTRHHVSFQQYPPSLSLSLSQETNHLQVTVLTKVTPSLLPLSRVHFRRVFFFFKTFYFILFYPFFFFPSDCASSSPSRNKGERERERNMGRRRIRTKPKTIQRGE